METSILSSTQKYAASALFALALHHSQVHQKQPSNHLVSSLNDEPIGEGASTHKTVSVSDNPHLWIHENSGLLLPVFRVMGVDDQAWDGLKETAGVSTQARHHVGSLLTLLSEENEGASSERRGKEHALLNAVDATMLGAETSIVPSQDLDRIRDYEVKCRKKYNPTKTELTDTTTKEEVDGLGSRVPESPMKEGDFLTEERKVTVLYELLSACIAAVNDHGSKGYDARHRVALRLLATWLDVKWKKMEAIEIMVACSLMVPLNKEDEDKDQKSGISHWKQGGMIGAAALTGGTLMALTGGIAAPAIAEGLGALAPAMGTIAPAVGGGFAAAATAAGSVAGSVAIGATFGAAGAGLAGSKMAKRVANLDEFEFHQIGKNHNQGRLAVGILISGIVSEEEDFLMPWQDHNYNLERYAIKWESKNLIALNNALQEWLTSNIAVNVMQTGAMLTVLSTLAAALTVPAALVSASNLIDNAWTTAVDRADKAGKLLAEVLLERMQGKRPVTLVGFSLGARVIFKCLQSLAEMEADNAGLVERVVLLGAPVSINDEKWEEARKMVAGRFVNVYSTEDWTLGIIFRASILSKGLAGTQSVDHHGIENIDATGIIEGHSSYLWMTKQILRQLDMDNYYPIFRTSQAKTQEEKPKMA